MGKSKKKSGTKTKARERKRRPTRSELDAISEMVEKVVQRELGEDVPFAKYEEAVLKITNEVARRRLEKKLQTMADGYPDGLRMEHKHDWYGWREGDAFNHRKHLPGTVAYHSLVGPLEVRRFTYRECARNGSTYVPLELDAGLMERMTPGLAKSVALGIADMPMRRYEKLLVASGRCPPSRSTLERSGRDLGAYALAANEEIEPLVRAEETVPTDAHAIVLGLDRTSVLMRKDHRFDGFCQEGGLRSNRPKQPWKVRWKGVRWRLDYVATVSFVDRRGERIESRHYRLPSEGELSGVVERMLEDVRHARTSRPDLGIAIVQDGAPELWKVLRTGLSEDSSVHRWEEVLDWYHLDEHLSRCLDICTFDDKQRARTRKRLHRFFHGYMDGAERALRSLRRQGQKLKGKQYDELQEHLSYLSRRRDQTRYPRFRRRGIPIGSGVTEGSCKSTIGMRAKGSGQHWTQRGLSSVLHLRSIVQSERFDPFWAHFSNRYRSTTMESTEL